MYPYVSICMYVCMYVCTYVIYNVYCGAGKRLACWCGFDACLALGTRKPKISTMRETQTQRLFLLHLKTYVRTTILR